MSLSLCLALGCPLSVVHALNSTIDISHKQLVSVLKQWCLAQKLIRVERIQELKMQGEFPIKNYQQAWKLGDRDSYFSFEIYLTGFSAARQWATIRICRHGISNQQRTLLVQGSHQEYNWHQDTNPFFLRTFYIENLLNTNFQLP